MPVSPGGAATRDIQYIFNDVILKMVLVCGVATVTT